MTDKFKQRNLCKNCRNMSICVFEKGIWKREECEHYDPLPLAERAERDEFIDSLMVPSCPKCGSDATSDCEDDQAVHDICVARCAACGTYFCVECLWIFPPGEAETQRECSHWRICEACPDHDESYVCPYSGRVWECPRVREGLARRV